MQRHHFPLKDQTHLSVLRLLSKKEVFSLLEVFLLPGGIVVVAGHGGGELERVGSSAAGQWWLTRTGSPVLGAGHQHGGATATARWGPRVTGSHLIPCGCGCVRNKLRFVGRPGQVEGQARREFKTGTATRLAVKILPSVLSFLRRIVFCSSN